MANDDGVCRMVDEVIECEEEEDTRVVAQSVRMLNASDFLRHCSDAPDVLAVRVPEWDEDGHAAVVHIRAWSGTERDAYTSMAVRAVDTKNYALLTAKLCAMSLCDEDGHLLFEAKDASEIGRINSTILERIASAIRQLNGLRKEDVEGAEGN